MQGLNVESGSASSGSNGGAAATGSHKDGSPTGAASPGSTSVSGSNQDGSVPSTGGPDGGSGNPNPSISNDSSSASHGGGLSTGVIAAIAVIVGLLLLLLLVCVCRRRYMAKRKDRQRTWWFGNKSSIFGSAAGSSYRDSGSPVPPSARSSFATTFDRGQFTLPDEMPPFWNVDTPITKLEMPRGDIQEQQPEMEQVWTNNLSAITIPPAATISSASSTSTIVRSPDRHQDWEGSSDSHGTVVQVPAMLHSSDLDSPTLPASPVLIRPFTPSETWSFPKPPRSTSSSSVLPGRPFSDAPSIKSESDNPFADFSEAYSARTRDSASIITADTETAMHFAPVETVCRPFVPTLPDEVAVSPGDQIHIMKSFDDGWAFAENLGTKQKGLLPVDCLRSMDEPLPAFLEAKRLEGYVRTSSGSQVSAGGASIGKAM